MAEGEELTEKQKKKLPKWARHLLVVVSIVGPLTGACVTVANSIIDVKAKAREADGKTKASYETLAPAVKELQDLLSKTQDIVASDDKDIAALKAERDDQEKRIMRLEAYIQVLSERHNLPRPPDLGPVVVRTNIKVRKLPPPARPIPKDVDTALVYQDKRVDMKCAATDPICGDGRPALPAMGNMEPSAAGSAAAMGADGP
jgi:hypothetical protein